MHRLVLGRESHPGLAILIHYFYYISKLQRFIPGRGEGMKIKEKQYTKMPRFVSSRAGKENLQDDGS